MRIPFIDIFTSPRRAAIVSSNVDAQAALLAAQQDAMSDVATQLADLTAATQSQTARAVYDTLAIEEGTGQVEYVWVNCGEAMAYQPLKDAVWSFTVDTHQQLQQDSGNTSTPGALHLLSINTRLSVSTKLLYQSAAD